MRSSTDLPAPEAPTRPRISPRSTSSVRFSSTVRSPNATVRPLTRITGSRGARVHPYIPIQEKKTAKKPSMTMTRKIDLTTDAVV